MPKKEESNEQQRAGFSRRSVLGAAGVTAAMFGVSSFGTSASAAAASSSTGPLTLDVVDYVDRTYVLVARGVVNGQVVSVGQADGLVVEVVGGAADVRTDRYTGNILVNPKPGESVSVRAIAPAGSNALTRLGLESAVDSGTVAVGYDAAEIADVELMVSVAGGGACKATVSSAPIDSVLTEMGNHIASAPAGAPALLADGMIDGSLRVRAAIQGNVIPVSPTERVINWKHARYYGLHDYLGSLRFTYDSTRPSQLYMSSKGASFFPASAVNSVYCRMEMLDLGMAAFSTDPMLLPADSVTWPPYSTPMNLSKPVDFFDETDPSSRVMTITENEMSLYDYNGVTIELEGYKITADGFLEAGYKVVNQTESVLNGRWVLIGDHSDSRFANSDAPITLGPAGSSSDSTLVEVRVPVGKSELTQRVSFAVLGLTDPLALGIKPLSFRFPQA